MAEVHEKQAYSEAFKEDCKLSLKNGTQLMMLST
jgi:hypothetical protein